MLSLLCAAVLITQEPLVIPTYELDRPNPNPVLPTAAGPKRPIYPYPQLDAYTSRRVDRKWNAVVLENEYLKVTVLPELGGKLHAIYDKTAGRDALYTNHVVKYADVAIRGAWTSGGIEWNFPDGHTATAVSPVDYAVRTEADGAASVTVGDTERVQRMQWAVTIRLRPGSKVVETEVLLNNRRDIPGRYWYWANAAARATDDQRFIYPMREAYPHAFWPVYSFPVHEGVDVSRYRSVKDALSLFARDSRRDFLGVYYERADHGIVHVADYRLVPGKKTWTWGTGPTGRAWIDILTDADGQYVEFQAGRFETQMEHEFMPPRQVDRFTHYWYPVDKLGGGFVEATRHAALNLVRDGAKARVFLNVNSPYPGAVLQVGTNKAPLHTQRADLAPGKPYKAEFEVPADAKAIAVVLTDSAGRQLLSYRTDMPADGNPAFRPATKPPEEPKTPRTAEQAYRRGMNAARESKEPEARNFWEDALKLDRNYAPALTAMGLSYYRTGEYATAAEYLERAAARDPEARYYLALVRRKPLAAVKDLNACLEAAYRPSLVHAVLGELFLKMDEPAEAIEHLSNARNDVRAATMLAVALRVAGRMDEARTQIAKVLSGAPLDYLALAEAARLGDARAAADLKRLLAREPDSALELAFDYFGVNRFEEGIAALANTKHAMAHYALAHFMALRGNVEGAQKEWAAAAAAPMDYVFPHRLEEIEVLRTAKDARAHYYLGSLLASKYRIQEAIAEWREAARLEPANALAWRNLGQYLTGEESVAAYRSAIQADPENYRVYVELAPRLKGDERLALFEKAPDSVRRRGAVALAFAEACAEAGRWEQAAELLDRAEITPGEGKGGPLRLYRKVHSALAEQHRKAGRAAEAAAEEKKLANPPRAFAAGV